MFLYSEHFRKLALGMGAVITERKNSDKVLRIQETNAPWEKGVVFTCVFVTL